MMDNMRDARDAAIQRERDKQDRTKALMRDLQDAQTDFEDCKRSQDALGMLSADKKMREAKDELGKMYPPRKETGEG